MLHADGELMLVGYGSTRVLATCRTAHFSPALLSLRLSTSPSSPAERTAEQSQQRPPACAPRLCLLKGWPLNHTSQQVCKLAR